LKPATASKRCRFWDGKGGYTDIGHPDTRDGWCQLWHEIRCNQALRNLPVIIYTSTAILPGDEQLALDLGVDEYVKKTCFDALRLDILQEYNRRLIAKLEEQARTLT
jgi:CheY-like chemotaxis protein